VVQQGADRSVQELCKLPTQVNISNLGENVKNLRRCEEYSYRLEQEVISGYDDEMQTFDLLLYFPSNNVEIWKEYRLEGFIGFLSEVGGAAGLLLGASALSLASMIVQGVTKISHILLAGKLRKTK